MNIFSLLIDPKIMLSLPCVFSANLNDCISTISLFQYVFFFRLKNKKKGNLVFVFIVLIIYSKVCEHF